MVFMRPRATPSPPAAPPKVEFGEEPHVSNKIAIPFVRDEQRPEKIINDSTMFSMADLL